LLFYVRFYDSELHLSLCALDVVASGIDDIIVQTVTHPAEKNRSSRSVFGQY
jgi:hypothetical protein